MRIRKGSGYYDYTDYTIGGCFRRAGEGGVSLDPQSVEVVRLDPYHGYNRLATTVDGRSVAFNSRFLEEGVSDDNS